MIYARQQSCREIMFSVVSVCNSVCSPERALYRALALSALCRAQPETQPPLYRVQPLYRSQNQPPHLQLFKHI